MEPLTISKFKTKNIKFGKTNNTNFGNFTDILYNYNTNKTSKLYIQTPKLLCKFGVNKNYNDSTGKLKDYTLSLYLYDEQESPIKISKLKQKFQKMDIKRDSSAKSNPNIVIQEKFEDFSFTEESRAKRY